MKSLRHDWGVILARGDSTRMGRPKGLCRLPDDDLTFLDRICRLYTRAEMPVVVVTRPDLAAIYREAIPGAAVAEWVLFERGGGTAASCLAAVEALADRATHLWLHPVDLPMVRDDTLAHLADVSVATSDSILIPHHKTSRGHPVVTPLAPWRGLEPVEYTGSMRDLIDTHAAAVLRVLLQDPGICWDFDNPEDLIE